jgi:hypothetical protein
VAPKWSIENAAAAGPNGLHRYSEANMKQRTLWMVSALWLGLLVAGLYAWQRQSTPAPAAPASAPQALAPAPDAAPAAPAASAIRFPIDTGASAPRPAPNSGAGAPNSVADALVDTLGRKAVLEFLNVDAFAHRVAATVDNLARAHAPARLWPVHPTAGRFATQQMGEGAVIGAENSRRYGVFVKWVDSLDMKGVAGLYRQLYPNFQIAYEALGYPGRYFNDRVVDVIDHLLETPSVDEPLAVKLADIKGPIQPARPWVIVEFADASLESRSAGQKLLLRMGPDHAGTLKAKLRQLRGELTPQR